jgi:hypothetical protein
MARHGNNGSGGKIMGAAKEMNNENINETSEIISAMAKS